MHESYGCTPDSGAVSHWCTVKGANALGSVRCSVRIAAAYWRFRVGMDAFRSNGSGMSLQFVAR